jgi:hypothetical protein
VTMCWALVHGRGSGEVHHAQHLVRAAAASCSVRLLVKASVPSAAHQQVRQVDAAVGGVGPLALRVEDVEVVAGHAAQHLGPAPRSRRAACRPGRARSRPICAARPAGWSTRPEVRSSSPSASQAWRPARCAPCCRRRCCGCRSCCCPPCRPAWPARWWTRPPGTTGRGLEPAFRWSSTMPGSTVAVRSAASHPARGAGACCSR